MVRIELKNWNGQFDNKGVLDRIRRKIEGGQASGTVLVDCEDAVLTPEQLAYIKAGFAPHKVKLCGSIATLPYPVPENAVLPSPPKRRRSEPRPRQRRGE